MEKKPAETKSSGVQSGGVQPSHKAMAQGKDAIAAQREVAGTKG